MQSPKDSTPSPRADDNDGNGREAAVAKTAGFVVFSGIAMSILKTLNPLNKNRNETTQPLTELTQPPPPPPQPQQPIVKPSICTEKSEPETTSCRTIEIVRGDTLWGLSRKYGVPIDAIKEANGLSGDTIYAGKKLIIP
ncbi:Peptidoglycan-binding lysin domain [Melia azedarach]|uniref:Peptidoglycan-binding lysin domain n=1 Tax=Melia azedarach TaxID=155640 RepID=A0ACC1Z163_MELAZ|nr:Peptidoglycan-binding lysin domain [Melia azedarach]